MYPLLTMLLSVINRILQVSWNQRDLLTYAVGVGAKATDLSVVYGTPSFYHVYMASTC